MTAPGSLPTRSGLLRPLLLAAAGLCVLGGVGWLALRATEPPPAPPAPAIRAAASPAPPSPAAGKPPAAPAAAPQAAIAAGPPSAPAAPPAAAPEKPSFDIVRVSPQGDTVVAGRAAPGAEITLKDNGQVIGTAKADIAGQFVILPAKPLGPGGRELTLTAKDAAGGQTTGSAPVVVAMPAPAVVAATPNAASPNAPAATAPATPAPLPGGVPLVMLTPQGAAPRLLQGPGVPQGPGAAQKPGAARLGLGVVDYGAGGEIRFAGNAPAGATIRLYIDNHPAAEITADAQGNWSAAPTTPVAPGTHILRLDQIAPGTGGGQVRARVELPFQRADLSARAAASPAPAAPGVTPAPAPPVQVVVQPTQNLWRIARGAYGEGIRYTDIYAANSEHIRDPNLIYPGQVFTIPPASAPGASKPASPSKSR